MPWAGRFAAGLALVSLVELLLFEVLPAAGRAVDLFVLLVVVSSLAGNSLRGLTQGLVVGLVQDALEASPFGLHGIACCVVGYGVARLSQRLATNHLLVASLLVALGTLVHQAIVFALVVSLEVGEPGVLAVSLRMAATTAVGAAGLWLFDGFRARWMNGAA